MNKITIKSNGNKKFNGKLNSIAKQQPNRKLLGIFRLYLGIYNLYSHKADSKIKDKLGEAPVIYDSTLNQPSLDLMTRFLNNKGYYENTVSVEILPHKKRKSLAESKKVKMVFTINKGERYLISRFDKEITDLTIKQIIESSNTNQNLKIYDPFDLDKLKEERIRVERLLKNFGYYKFSREYVVFEADTSQRTKSAALKMVIKNPTINYYNTDSLIEGKHQTYTINSVQVRINGNQTTELLHKGDTSMVDSMLFINLKEKEFNKKAISRITYIRPGQLFSLKNQEETYRNLSSLKLFSNVSIQYEPDFYANDNGLIATIDLKPRKQKSLTIETEGTNNGGNLGVNGTVNFQNNNTFKGAEILNISFNGGLEAQTILTGEDEKKILGGFLPFNTLEFGPEINLEIPRFLLPVNADRFSPRGNPRTTFNASYNLQERPDYRRDVTKTYIAYSWNESANKTHVIQPFDLSYIKLDPSNTFSAALENIENPFLRNSYTDNLILASKYSFIYNSKNSNRLKNYIFFRGNIESAGNLLSLFTKEKGQSINEDSTIDKFAEIAGIRFAQYIRADIDFRYYQIST
ncbi:MAG: hypothetical protein JKY48_00380 [Flavobacteriales bacterium]|nr:hypothetical protein [Flavobacteriales bacterium]